MEGPMMGQSANGRVSSHSMRLLEVWRVYDTGMGVSNRRCEAEAACTISAQRDTKSLAHSLHDSSDTSFKKSGRSARLAWLSNQALSS